jgi:hypothetical protein
MDIWRTLCRKVNMDSRIRELEQWLAEAKEDLGTRGQEAYLRKLYLLDAEIRAVIKASGAQPEAGSPQPKERLVRGRVQSRQRWVLAPGMAMVLVTGGLGLLATTAVLYGGPALEGAGTMLARLAQPGTQNVYPGQDRRTLSADAGKSSTTPPAGFVPATFDIPGEEILSEEQISRWLVAGWTPVPEEMQLATPSQEEPAFADGTSVLARAGDGSTPALAGKGPGGESAAMMLASLPAAQPRGFANFNWGQVPRNSDSVDVLMAANGEPAKDDNMPSLIKNSGAADLLHGSVTPSSGGGLGERLISRLNFKSSEFSGFPMETAAAEKTSQQVLRRGREVDVRKLKHQNGSSHVPGDAQEIVTGDGQGDSPAAEENRGQDSKP